MKKLFTLLTVLALSFPVFAQDLKVSGRLVDETGAPVEFADIVVTTAGGAPRAGGISNENGEFSFTLDSGRFTLQASSIGYQTLTITCSAEDLGELTMPKDIQQLESATVQAQRTVQKGSQFLVVPDPKDVAASTKGLDLLGMQQLPGLKVDRAFQSITVDGGTPVFKINGREVSASRLSNLDPSKIKRIEYSNTPGLRYLDRGATGVINLVLKEPDDGGSIYFWGRTDPQLMMSDSYLSGSYHKGRSELALEYSFSRRKYKRGPSEDIDSYIAPERIVEREMKTDRPVYYMNNDINLEYTFQANDSTMFVASLDNSLFESNNIGTGSMLLTDRGVTAETLISGDTPSNTVAPVLDLFFSRKFAHGRKLELNAVGQYNIGKMARNITYTTGGIPESYPTDVRNRGYAVSAEGVYGRQFDKVGTRFGVQYQHNYARNDYRTSDVISEMIKDNTYVFAQAEGPIGEKVSWTAGTGLKIFDVHDGASSKAYVRNLSTAQLNWRMGERWTMTTEARYTPSLPSLSDLSPVLLRTDNVEASQGNASLKPSQTLDTRILLRYAAKNGWYANIQGGYQHTFDDIISTYHYDATSDLFVSTPQNSDFYMAALASVDAGVKNLFDHFNLSVYAMYRHEQTKGDGFNHKNDNLSVDIDFQTVWKNFTAGCSFNVKPMWYLRGEFLSMNERAQNIYAQYNIKNVTVFLNWHCPFNRNGYKYETIGLSEVHPMHHVNWTVDNGNMINLGLNWNLEFGSAFKKGNKTLNNGGYDAGIVR